MKTSNDSILLMKLLSNWLFELMKRTLNNYMTFNVLNVFIIKINIEKWNERQLKLNGKMQKKSLSWLALTQRYLNLYQIKFDLMLNFENEEIIVY